MMQVHKLMGMAQGVFDGICAEARQVFDEKHEPRA
jgi:hypothetical protein